MSRLATLPVALPSTPIGADTDPVDIANQYRNIFSGTTEDTFAECAVWRDTYALTGTLRTFYGQKGVFAAWNDCKARMQPHSFQVHANESQIRPSWIEINFSFETSSTPPLLCSAALWMTKSNEREGWKIWVMTTVLTQIKNAPSVDVYKAPAAREGIATENVPLDKTNNKASNGIDGYHEKVVDFDCVIVGAGQAGLDTAARCKALGVSYLVVERNREVGDNWALRYDSARLHTIRDYAHFPFDRTFTEDYPEFLSKDDLATGYRSWVKKFDINIWPSTELASGSWNNTSKTWNLELIREGESQQQEISCFFVIVAVGAGGQIPLMPVLTGRDSFNGLVQHSEEYKSAHGWGGKHAVVVGTANTAHDVAEDMVDAGCKSVTMVQRSETFVFPAEWYVAATRKTYNADFPIALADRLGQSNPYAVLRLIVMASMHAMAKQNMGRFEALGRAGFRVNPFGDPVYHIFEKLGGHYMDVGASQKIIDGRIKMKSDASLTHYTPSGLGFDDGSELPADVVVFATGFDLNIRNRVQELFGDEVSKYIGDFSHMDNEGELSGAYKFQHPGLACIGGAIGPCRWYSRFLAMHVKAALMGTPFQVYDKTPVPPNHNSKRREI